MGFYLFNGGGDVGECVNECVQVVLLFVVVANLIVCNYRNTHPDPNSLTLALSFSFSVCLLGSYPLPTPKTGHRLFVVSQMMMIMVMLPDGGMG